MYDDQEYDPRDYEPDSEAVAQRSRVVTEMEELQRRLEGRVATCRGRWKDGQPVPGHKPRPSSPLLAFFVYDGEGSAWTHHCVGCGIHESAHQRINPHTGRPGITDHQFVPRPPKAWDSYYCGCRGWD